MNDTETVILHSFLFAVHEQAEPLPEQITKQIQEISQDLENRVMELDAVAQSTPSLTPLYKDALDQLLGQSAQRMKGLENQPGELKNPPKRSNVVRVISQQTTPENAQEILSSPNPPNAAQQTFQFPG
ncbi:MAG: hypothetical protein MJA27_15580 [Pseudanabaenales cyanobacterium]|nr:hypothetical protein [Pseudanabaenales cyanobacterium]